MATVTPKATTVSREIESAGAWPFSTRKVFLDTEGQAHVWESRHHRKRLAGRLHLEIRNDYSAILLRMAQSPQSNLWIGSIFALGAAFFAIASVLGLSTALASQFQIDSNSINIMFFVGSIPFTTAAYLQLLQAANAEPSFHVPTSGNSRTQILGWRPTDLGWLSAALRFAGTLLFDRNTYDAMLRNLSWIEEDLEVWVPDLFGSILFLISGNFAFIEVCHAHWAFRPRQISWWVVSINFAGCIGFMVSAIFAVVIPGSPSRNLGLHLFGADSSGRTEFLRWGRIDDSRNHALQKWAAGVGLDRS